MSKPNLFKILCDCCWWPCKACLVSTGSGSYRTGLCCCSCGLQCCFLELCGCVQAGLNFQAIHGQDLSESICTLLFYGHGAQICLKKDVRAKSGIKGCLLSDCCATTCCQSCSLQQDAVELNTVFCQ